MSAPVVVLICARSEWRAVLAAYPQAVPQSTPFGGLIQLRIGEHELVFVQTGVGKIAAAAAAQYALMRWQPQLLVNLGTCGGIAGQIERGEVLLADQTVVYDIYESMGDADAMRARFITQLDLSWLREPYPQTVRKGLLVSGDRDLDPAQVGWLHTKFGAVAGDWESGAIAWVAQHNAVRCLILRGVSDLVSEQAGEVYDDLNSYHANAQSVMAGLLAALPQWIGQADGK